MITARVLPHELVVSVVDGGVVLDWSVDAFSCVLFKRPILVALLL